MIRRRAEDARRNREHWELKERQQEEEERQRQKEETAKKFVLDIFFAVCYCFMFSLATILYLRSVQMSNFERAHYQMKHPLLLPR